MTKANKFTAIVSNDDGLRVHKNVEVSEYFIMELVTKDQTNMSRLL